MTEHPIDLDGRRGMTAQKETELRRARADVAADHDALKARQAELEEMLIAAPSPGWREAVHKTRYLLGLLAETLGSEDDRRRRLLQSVQDDFERLLAR